jgi:hypothetical protein
MGELVPLRFVGFCVAVGLLIYLQYYLAHRQWRRIRGTQVTEIDVGYVRTESYFAQSFRLKLQGWMQLPATTDASGDRLIQKGQERIRIVPGTDFGAGERCDDILVVNGNFSCGPACVLTHEICVHGSSKIGAQTELQSLAADGDLELGDYVKVARWVDSNGELTLGEECQTGSRVTSLKRIRLGPGTAVLSACAPEVATAGWTGEFPNGLPPAGELVELAFPDSSEFADGSLTAAGLNPKKFHQLSPDCWIYRGDVRPPKPVRLKKSLVVKGDCYLPGGSVVDGDLKVSGLLYIGPSSVCNGNLVADGHIYAGSGCRFAGMIHSGRSVLLSQGTRGFSGEAGQVAAYAQENLWLGANVAVRGKLSAGGRVKVLDAAAAEAWRRQVGIREDGSAPASTRTP